MTAVTSPTVHTVRRLTAALARLALWFWGIAVTVVVVGNLVGWATVGATDVSLASYARQAATWFPFSLAIMVVSAYLRVHLASGMTRRTFVRAAVVVEVAAGLAYGLALTALVLVERAVHDAAGWDSVMTDLGLAQGAPPAGVVLLTSAVPFVLSNLCGLLVGAVYQRVGGRWGTLLLPLTVGPVAVSLYLPGARATGGGPWASLGETQFVLATAALYAGLAVLTAVAFAVVTRRLPVAARP